MADLLRIAERYIDEGIYEGPESVNRMNCELSEVADGIAVIEAFSHIVVFATDEGLLVFDTTLEELVAPCLESLRRWTDKPVHTIVYTHGHVDHVGGAEAFVEDTRRLGAPRPRIVGHDNLPKRFDRYVYTNGYNKVINQRQFSSDFLGGENDFGPTHWQYPDTVVRDRLGLRVGELEVDIRHARGETDDHLWGWIPARRAIATGDLMTWVFPNAGNPQKVQRYPRDWAAALREMASLEPELLLSAHGLPIAGAARIRGVLDTLARVLESLEEQAVRMMNEGADLDAIIHGVKLPTELADRPYLQPVYDEPEFVVRNIWRLYGGWYDGNPANLKPAPASALAREIADLAGGAGKLSERALALSEKGEGRLACHLAEMAVRAEPEGREAHRARAEVYKRRGLKETSVMAQGVFRWAARESKRIAGEK